MNDETMKAIKNNARVPVNYEKIIKRAEKLNISLRTISLAIGKTSGYIAAMSGSKSKMLYCDLKQVARILNVHGANKLILEADNNGTIEEDVIADMKANLPTDERIAAALESIAISLKKMQEDTE